jgi:oxygen-independent coproporphyrinogen-3 oxidase
MLSSALGLELSADNAADDLGLSDLLADGLIRLTPTAIEVTPTGAPLLRVIAMRFDTHFAPAPRRHAQAI